MSNTMQLNVPSYVERLTALALCGLFLRCGEVGPRGDEGMTGQSGPAGSEGPPGTQGPNGVEGRAGQNSLEGCSWSLAGPDFDDEIVAFCDFGFYAVSGGCGAIDHTDSGSLKSSNSVVPGSDLGDLTAPPFASAGTAPSGWRCLYNRQANYTATALCCPLQP